MITVAGKGGKLAGKSQAKAGSYAARNVFLVPMQSVEKGSRFVAECIITLFGIPKVTLDGMEVKLGSALPLLALLILLRGDASVTADDLAFLLRPRSEAEEPASFLKKRKQKIRTLLKMTLPNTLRPLELGPAILEQAWVDVAQFDEKIASPDSREVREAVALRRLGPLMSGWPASDLIEKERGRRERSYQTALWRLIQEDRREKPEQAVRWVDLLLGFPDLHENSILALREERLTLEHHSFRAKVFGPGKTTQVWRPPSLPSSPTSLIGRDAEIEAVEALLFSSRLVTLTGTAGVGKTRLALAAAQRFQQSVPHGAAFADFSTAVAAAQISQQAGLCLGLTQEADRTPSSLMAFLEDKNLLLVWDNCEHLVEACADFAADILRRCPGVRILATSREPLRAYGEAGCPVSALQDPDAVRLFAARARLVKMDFRLTPENTPQVSQICHDLDGLPLAVELAASLADTLTLPQLASQLGRRFDLLSDGPRTGPARHRSLRAAFDVSYDLLSPAEQALFHRLGIFSGSFTAEAAAAVCADTAPDLFGVSTLLTQLVRKSLVSIELGNREIGGDEVRYRQLETVRHYAGEHLKKASEWTDAQRRHRLHFLRVAEQAEPHLKGPEPKRWMDRLARDGANLRSALEWQADTNSLRIACALLRFWQTHGHLQESRRWLEHGARTAQDAPDALRARALNGAGSAAFALGDFQDAQALHHESLALAERVGDEAGRAEALNSLGGVAAHLGDYDKANELILASLALRRQVGNKEGIASCLSYAGMVTNYQCRYAEARTLLEESLHIAQALQDAHSVASCLHNLGIIAYYQLDFSAAHTYFERSLALWRPIGDKYSVAKALSGLGEVALRCGDYSSAQEIYTESLLHRQEAGDKYGIANSLNGLGEAAMYLGDYPAAAEFFKESMTLRQQIGDIQSLAHSQHNLGQLALRQNNSIAAQTHFTDSLRLMRQNKDLYGIAHSLEGLAGTWLLAEPLEPSQAGAAVRLLGAAASLRTALKSPHFPEDLEEYRRRLADVRALLGEEAFAAAWAEGQAMTWEQAVAFALEEKWD
jgi:predicted ATPase